MHDLPRLYTDLASWWPVLSAPEDYAEEAEFYRKHLVEDSAFPIRSVLELGSGGGSNASHLKRHFQLTLVDLAPGMIEVSKRLNPECEHICGDMRSVRLGRLFDAVFVHDAVSYMTTEEDLRRAAETAAVHCRPGGAVIFAPDAVRETFRESTHSGGHDRQDRSMRYLEWTFDPDPSDTTVVSDFAYLLREAGGKVRCEYDHHVLGLFPREVWLSLLTASGFSTRSVPFVHSEIEPGSCEMFLCRKRDPGDRGER